MMTYAVFVTSHAAMQQVGAAMQPQCNSVKTVIYSFAASEDRSLVRR